MFICITRLLGNITVGKACVSSLQCTGSQYSQHCAGGVCVCQKGYIPFNNSCLQGNFCSPNQNQNYNLSWFDTEKNTTFILKHNLIKFCFKTFNGTKS